MTLGNYKNWKLAATFQNCLSLRFDKAGQTDIIDNKFVKPKLIERIIN